jgi:hypothetical protein
MNKLLLIGSVVITTAASTSAQSTEADRAYTKARQAYNPNFYFATGQRQRQFQNYHAATTKKAAVTAAVYEVAPKGVDAIAPVKTIAEAAPKTAAKATNLGKDSAIRKHDVDNSTNNRNLYPSNQTVTDVRLLYPNNPAM